MPFQTIRATVDVLSLSQATSKPIGQYTEELFYKNSNDTKSTNKFHKRDIFSPQILLCYKMETVK
jgi:hypothetical protein